MRFLLRFSAGTTLALATLAFPSLALAQIPNPCPIAGIPCMTGGLPELEAFARTFVFSGLRIGFIAVLIFMFFVYAFRLLVEGEEESTITDIKNAYGQAIVGIAVVSLSTFIIDAFGRDAAETVVNAAPLEVGLGNIIFYLRLMVSVAVTGLIVYQGIRLILLQGQDSQLDEQKKRFFNSLLGVAIILLANAIVAAVQPGSNSSIIAMETVGIVNFLLEILAALSVVSFIAAGVFLILSAEESMKDRAKKMMFGTVISLIIVMVSFVIMNYFLFL